MRSFLFLILLFTSACTDLKMKSSHDPNVDFDKYKTWYWMNGCMPVYEGPEYIDAEIILVNMANYIAVEMQSKGYLQDDENPDILLDFRITTKEDSATSALIHEESLPLWEHNQENDIYYHFLVGTLIIEISDFKEGRVIWRSVTEKYLPKYPLMKPFEIEKGIKKALKDYPSKKNMNGLWP